MKHYITVPIPATERKAHTHTTCDVCGVDVRADGTYEVLDISVHRDSGTQYPEGGSGQKTQFDLCGACFEKHVAQHLKSLGAEPTVTEWEN